MKLCCVFNYPPAYRQSIYKKIDEAFDTQFIWAEEVIEGQPCDIKRLDYSILKKKPIINKNKFLFGKLYWCTKMQTLPFKGYDCILVTGTGSYAAIPMMMWCRALGVKVYGWGHGHKQFTGPLIRRFLDRISYKLINGFFSYGEGGRKRLIELGIPANKIFVIYNSLCEHINAQECDLLKSNVIVNHFNNKLPTIFFIGRLTKIKQLDWLIKAKVRHNSEGVFYNLLIIGDGQMGDELKRMAEEYNISEEIWFYGECYDNSKLKALIYNSDLCVSPGNVGLTALHSMMYGTPVLSHDDFETQMPEYETIIPNMTGLLYKHGSFEDFCEKISKWLRTNHDRQKIRSNCYKMINGKWNSNYQINLIKDILIHKIDL